MKDDTNLLGREESKPSKTAQDARLLLLVLESSLRRDGSDKVLLIGRRSRDDLLGNLLPGEGLLAEALLLITEEANVDEDLDELGEPSVSQSASVSYMLGTCIVTSS